MATTDNEVSGSAPGLRRNAIGLREVLFQSITCMAPGAAIAASIPAGAGYAGGSLPLAVGGALLASGRRARRLDPGRCGLRGRVAAAGVRGGAAGLHALRILDRPAGRRVA